MDARDPSPSQNRTDATAVAWEHASGDLFRSVAGIEAVIQSISDGVAVADERGQLRLFNCAAEELLGIGLTDTLPGEWAKTYGLFLPDGQSHCPADELPLARALRGEQVDGMELVVRSQRREKPVPILVRARPIHDDRGELRGGVAVFHDITKQKQAQRAVRRARDQLEVRVAQRTVELMDSEARYQDLYNNAPAMFLSVDALASRIVRCNHTLLQATGYSEQQIVGRDMFDLYHPDCLPTLRRTVQTFLQTGEVKDVELLLRRADGGTIDVNLTVSAERDADGKIVQGRTVMRDITEQKRAEEQIRCQQEELTHVARLSTMGEMAAGLAHELNQPLAAIAAYAEGALVRIEQGNATKKEIAEVVSRIAADAHRAGEVIRRLRKFVKKRAPDRAPLNVNETIREVCRFVSADASQQETSLHLNLADDLPDVLADVVQVQQVLLNLIRNSLDAMSESDNAERRILLHTRETPTRDVEVIVQDTGPGLSLGLEDQVFEQFFTSKDDGLGLGLAISRSIVEAHGGRIWFAASPHATAHVHFTLPTVSTELHDA